MATQTGPKSHVDASQYHELLETVEQPISQGPFQRLNSPQRGTLLNRLSDTVAKNSGPAATWLTGKENIVSDLYISAVQNLP